MIQSDNYFILWSNNATASALKKDFSLEYVICSAPELRTAKLDLAKGIIVLCELNWDEKGIEREPSKFCGVDLVRHHLRLSRKLKAPILFVSFMPESYFKSAKYMIMNAVGHRFKQLEPSIWGSWEKEFLKKDLNPLNQIQFSDIVTNLCDLRGLIGEIIHNAENKVPGVLNHHNLEKNKKLEQVFQILEDSLDDICSLLNYRTDMLSVKKEVIYHFKQKVEKDGNLDEAKTFLSQYREQLQALAQDTEVPATPMFLERGWKILLLDDDPDGIKEIIKNLKKYGVVIDVYKDALEATKAIEENEKAVENKKKIPPITVVISDYRLYIPGTKRHQPLQGYDFLLQTSDPSQHDLKALVALSGLNRSFLLESFRKYNCRVEVYAKADIITSDRAAQVFAENIIQLGEENYQALLSKPRGKWKTDKKPFYVAYRQSADYAEAEYQIRIKARNYVDVVRHILNDRSNSNHLQMPGLDTFSDLSTSLSKNVKLSFSEKMEIFQKLLIARRIAIWLIFFEGFGIKSVYTALIHGILDASHLEKGTPTPTPEEKSRIKGKVTDLITTHLCISIKDFPTKLLVEEISWLKYDMGVDIDDMRAVFLQVHEHFNEGFRRHPKLIEFIYKHINSLVNKESNNEKYSELKQNFREDHGELIFTVVSIGDLKRIVRYIGKEIKDRDMVKESIDMLENILVYINKDYNGAFVIEDVSRYILENIEILKKRNSEH